VAQRLVAIERLRQREDDRFGAGAVMLRRGIVLHGSSEVEARGMDSPASRRDVELRHDRERALDVALGALPVLRGHRDSRLDVRGEGEEVRLRRRGSVKEADWTKYVHQKYMRRAGT
jgi:hypothetical protein